ncbi:hypothetical protein Dimus_033032 [Dionaea muscipula]
MKGETMVSDLEIAQGVEALLRQSTNPNSVSSVNGVVQQLGAKLGLDLSHKAGFIRDQINLLRQYSPQPPSPSPSSLTAAHHPQLLSPRDQFALLNHHHQRLPHPQFHPQYPPPHLALHFPSFPAGTLHPQQHQHQHQHQQFYHPQPQVAAQLQSQPQFVAQPAKNVAAASSPAEKTSKESASTGAKRRAGTGGLSKVCGLSPELQAVVGQSALPRTEVVKQLWVYIRKHNLQDPSNKRKIICDDALRLVFETDCTDMFKMNKLLSKHIFSLQATNESAPAKRSKVDVEDTSQGTESVSPSTAVISQELATFLGSTRREMDQREAKNRVWDYIKANGLEDTDTRVIICDEKLRQLFQCESIPVSGLNEMLASRHLVQSS